ncbi:D(2) dopamine receptor-like [Amphiura filiformis]|uniref:D(2) dopamine receptor-like n=1 Tax=Amphiura filiformis TaxID=82378 RepID=UPI003B220580
MLKAIISVWILSTILSISVAFLQVGEQLESDDGFVCIPQKSVFCVILAILDFYIPCVVLITLYTLVFVAIRKLKRKKKTKYEVGSDHAESPSFWSTTVRKSSFKLGGQTANNEGSKSPRIRKKGTYQGPQSLPCLLTADEAKLPSVKKILAPQLSLPIQTSAKDKRPKKKTSLDVPKSHQARLNEQRMKSNLTKETPRKKISLEVPQTNDQAVNDADTHQDISKKPSQTSSSSNASTRGSMLSLYTALNRIKPRPLAREQRSVTILAAILLAFICTWTPFFCFMAVHGIQIYNFQIDPTTLHLFHWLGWFNSILNPLLYASLKSDFRKAFKKICTRTEHRRQKREKKINSTHPGERIL